MATVVSGKKVSALTAITNPDDNALLYISNLGTDRKITWANAIADFKGDLFPAGGTNGQVLTTNGSGTYSWTTVGGITVNGTTDNGIPTYNSGAGRLDIESTLTYTTGFLRLVGGVSTIRVETTTGTTNEESTFALVGGDGSYGALRLGGTTKTGTFLGTIGRDNLLSLEAGALASTVKLALGTNGSGSLYLGTNQNVRLEVNSSGSFDFKGNSLTAISSISTTGFPTTNQPAGTLWNNGGVITMGTL